MVKLGVHSAGRMVVDVMVAFPPGKLETGL
jgi:hypothetical protein